MYEFAGFRLDPDGRHLTGPAGEPLPLPPRAFDTLLHLVERRGELIRKRHLLVAVWGTTIVADNSLDQIISILRRALRDRNTSQPLIVTERGRGYRFVGSVTHAGAQMTERAALSADVPTNTQSPAADNESEQLLREAQALIVRPSRSNLRGALELLTAATERRPQFARAIAERALLRTLFPLFEIPMRGAYGTAEREAEQALALDPMLGRAHQALAYVLMAHGDWVGAARHFDSACRMEESPDAQVARVGLLSASVGHLRLALTQAREIAQKVPFMPLGAVALTSVHTFLGQDADALATIDRIPALGWPRTQTPMSELHFLLAARAGRLTEAVVYAREGLTPEMRAAGGERMVEQLCAALQAPERGTLAIAAIRKMLGALGITRLGLRNQKRILIWLTMLGALDDAFELLRCALDDVDWEGAIRGPWAWLWLPEMLPFRCDARFQGVIARFGFIDYWNRYGPPDGHKMLHGKLIYVEAEGES